MQAIIPPLALIAITSLALGALCWAMIPGLKKKPRALSSFLIISALTLMLLPAITFWHQTNSHAGSSASITQTQPNQTPAVPSPPPITSPPVNESFHKTVIPDSEPAVSLPIVKEPATAAPISTPPTTPDNPSPLIPYPYPQSHAAPLVKSITLELPQWLSTAAIWAAAIWAAGIVIQLLSFIWSHLVFQREIKSHTPVTDDNIRSLYQKVAHTMGVKPPPLMTSENGSPCCYGIFNSRLFVPRQILTQSNREELTMVLRHELQHIRQHDLALLALQLPVRIFYWWNPLVTRLMKRLDLTRETLCDHAASNPSPKAYAQLLIQHATATAPTPITTASMASNLQSMKSRIRQLYQTPHNDRLHFGLACSTLCLVTPWLALSYLQVASAEITSPHHTPAAEPPSTTPKQSPTLSPREMMTHILSAEESDRIRIAAHTKTPNNPVLPHYTIIQEAQTQLQQLRQKLAEQHPTIISQKDLIGKHTLLANQAILKLLATLQKQVSEQKNEPPKQQPLPPSKKNYTHYLKQLQKLPQAQQYDFARKIPLPNNPAADLWKKEREIEDTIASLLASGLGEKHPSVIALKNHLNQFSDSSKANALLQTTRILEGKPTMSAEEKRLMQLRLQYANLLAQGLGKRHPDALMLKTVIHELAQKLEKKAKTPAQR